MTAIRQSTARTILIGPILDADGVAVTTGPVIGDIRLTKNGVVSSAAAAATLTHDHAGKWLLVTIPGNSDTVGILQISLSDGVNDMPVLTFTVVEEAIYDAIYAASAVPPVTAGQTITVANGAGESDLTYIHGSALNETATQLAGAFEKFFDVAAPTGTANSLPDAVPGTASGGALTSDVTSAHSATDALIGSISAGSSGFSLNASGVTVTTGSETNSYTDTASAGIIHILTAAGGVTLYEYDFDLSEFNGTATEFIWDSYVQTNGDSVDIQYFNWPTTSYLTLRTISGINGTTLIERAFDVPVGATGTGANFGLVKMRLTSSSTTNIGTDRVRCVFNALAGGITNGSTITLAATELNKNFIGQNWTLALGGQDISGSYIHGANVSGISSGSSDVTFEDCELGGPARSCHGASITPNAR